ncbi:uncharacterized protein Dwil_GK18852 [Drosophila willistoni]|uniref:Uncharacterized protein n=1 Tax=Drosophila willistoni TaxID=7260 RepID=B4NDX5_DROWI|nr:uncharacterized protein LOC6648654 [Drosophila willistoni]EDW81944.2 uncharacterized protein Dwil_GK18852 [Drosophila willistoni]
MYQTLIINRCEQQQQQTKSSRRVVSLARIKSRKMKLQLSLGLMASTLLLLAGCGMAEKRDILRTSSLPMVRRLRANDAVVAGDGVQIADQKLVKEQDASSASATAGSTSTGNKDASSGRLFLKKFLMFKNMFSSSSQPVIPIIITGAGTGTTTGTSPTVTLTSTGTIPSATGTITTSPTATSPTTTSPTTSARRRFNEDGEQIPIVYGQNVDNNGANEDADAAADEASQDDEDDAPIGADNGYAAMAAINPELLDEQALQAALAAGAQEYEVVTNEPVQGTAGATESKATQNNNRINLRRKSNRRGQSGQVISVRIPPRYRRYFKNGQKVMLNTNSRPNKRRVIRKRVQPNRNNRNKNKRLQQRRRRVGNNKNKNKKNKNKNKGNKRTRIQAI